MMFIKVSMKELALILIHVHKIFNRKVSFKILVLMCLVIVEKNFKYNFLSENSNLSNLVDIQRQHENGK